MAVSDFHFLQVGLSRNILPVHGWSLVFILHDLTIGEAVFERCSVRKGVPGNFAKFTGKHLCQSLFFNKVAGLRPEACNFIKKETLAQVFFCKFYEISKNTFSYRTPPAAASPIGMKYLHSKDFEAGHTCFSFFHKDYVYILIKVKF